MNPRETPTGGFWLRNEFKMKYYVFLHIIFCTYPGCTWRVFKILTWFSRVWQSLIVSSVERTIPGSKCEHSGWQFEVKGIACDASWVQKNLFATFLYLLWVVLGHIRNNSKLEDYGPSCVYENLLIFMWLKSWFSIYTSLIISLYIRGKKWSGRWR